MTGNDNIYQVFSRLSTGLITLCVESFNFHKNLCEVVISTSVCCVGKETEVNGQV